MALRFRRSIRIAPGVRLNVGKKSMSVRVGGRGFGVTTGTSGTRVSAGIPGTGIYATKKVSGPSKSRRPIPKSKPTARRADAFPIGWFLGALVFTLTALGGVAETIPLALVCLFMFWRRRRRSAVRHGEH